MKNLKKIILSFFLYGGGFVLSYILYSKVFNNDYNIFPNVILIGSAFGLFAVIKDVFFPKMFKDNKKKAV